MKKFNKQNGTNNFEQFVKEFGGILSAFQTGIDGVMDVIMGSFENTKKESAEITALFTQSRSEAEVIFSIFSGIAGIFSGGGGGIISAIFGLIPGGEFISSIFGNSLASLQGNSGANQSMYPSIPNHIPATTVIVNTQLEKAGMYRVYREGKIISESRP